MGNDTLWRIIMFVSLFVFGSAAARTQPSRTPCPAKSTPAETKPTPKEAPAEAAPATPAVEVPEELLKPDQATAEAPAKHRFTDHHQG